MQTIIMKQAGLNKLKVGVMFIIFFYFLAFFVYNGAEATKVIVQRIPVFTSNDVPFDNGGRHRSMQPYFLAICEVFQKSGHQFRAAPENLTPEEINETDAVISFDLWGFWSDLLRINRFPLEKRIFFLWEPPVVLQEQYSRHYHTNFAKIFTMVDDLVDNRRYYKFYYPQDSFEMEKVVPFHQKKLCTQISANKKNSHPDALYSERLKVIHYFEKHKKGDFDFYGQWWGDLGYKNYKGPVRSKKEVLKNYKFAFCYENSKNVNGYISEKIFDCFTAGCVPIYWGAENVTKFIPANCFIDRRKFSSTKEVYKYIKKMTADEYQTYIDNIRTFLSSNEAYFFSFDYFVDLLAKNTIAHYDRNLFFNEAIANRLALLEKMRPDGLAPQ